MLIAGVQGEGIVYLASGWIEIQGLYRLHGKEARKIALAIIRGTMLCSEVETHKSGNPAIPRRSPPEPSYLI